MYNKDLSFYYVGFKYNLVRLGELQPRDCVREYWIHNGELIKCRTFYIASIEQKLNKVGVVQPDSTFLRHEKIIQFFLPITIEGMVKRVANHDSNEVYFAYRWDGCRPIYPLNWYR